jgi:hypothetical protein
MTAWQEEKERRNRQQWRARPDYLDLYLLRRPNGVSDFAHVVTAFAVLDRYRSWWAMSNEDFKAELEQLRKENAALRKQFASGIRLKVSEKGEVSVYGIRRFPVTLYREQWLKLLDRSSDIRAFIAANKSQLKAKDRWFTICWPLTEA